ncbi:MAG: hypothetical protein SGPRY_004498 [Prymnesium sp.]
MTSEDPPPRKPSPPDMTPSVTVVSLLEHPPAPAMAEARVEESSGRDLDLPFDLLPIPYSFAAFHSLLARPIHPPTRPPPNTPALSEQRESEEASPSACRAQSLLSPLFDLWPARPNATPASVIRVAQSSKWQGAYANAPHSSLSPEYDYAIQLHRGVPEGVTEPLFSYGHSPLRKVDAMSCETPEAHTQN